MFLPLLAQRPPDEAVSVQRDRGYHEAAAWVGTGLDTETEVGGVEEGKPHTGLTAQDLPVLGEPGLVARHGPVAGQERALRSGHDYTSVSGGAPEEIPANKVIVGQEAARGARKEAQPRFRLPPSETRLSGQEVINRRFVGKGVVPPQRVLPPSSVATPCLNASVSWPACVGERH